MAELRRTQEYQDVFAYMQGVLYNEFPTQEFTPEYLILSILDNARCHANILMDNVLMSESMEYLRMHYYDELKTTKRKKGFILKRN